MCYVTDSEKKSCFIIKIFEDDICTNDLIKHSCV